MSDKQWYVAVDGQSFGPFSENDLRAKFQAGEYSGPTPRLYRRDARVGPRLDS